MMNNVLPEGLTVRPPTMDDLESVFELSRAYDLAQYGEEDLTLDELRTIWSSPTMHLEDDERLVFDQAGQLLGSMHLEHRLYTRFFVIMRIRPGYNDPGLGATLLELAETWAHERMKQSEPDARVTLNTWTASVDQDSIQQLERAGFREVRRHWRMRIDLREEPVAPIWPAGLELRPFVPGRDDRAVFEMIETAFSDHWGHIPHDFDEWKHWTVERSGFDPSLWFVAYEGDQIAGGAFCVDGTIGWVDTLGILRPWRRKGLGLALLQHTFGEFYRRGRYSIGLGVDSRNLTGAVRLYKRAGMHIERESISFEKELRAGVELSTRELVV